MATNSGRAIAIVKILAWSALALTAVLAVGFALGYLLTAGAHTVPATVAHDPGLPRVTIDGVTYHAETFGDPSDPVVITIHGGPGGDYRSILSLRELADDYYVVFFDQRGAGLSPRVDPVEITLDSAIGDLDAIVEHYGRGERVDIVGHSWGAMLASAYVGQHPDKVDHLVLAEPGFLATEFAVEWSEKTKLRPTPRILFYLIRTKFEAMHVKGPDADAKDDYVGQRMMLYPGQDGPQVGYHCQDYTPSADEHWRYGARAADALWQEAFNAEGDLDISLVEGVAQHDRKVLFMAGACQQIIGEDWQRRQMAYFEDAELVVIPDTGHEMFLGNPDASVEAVRGYLSVSCE